MKFEKILCFSCKYPYTGAPYNLDWSPKNVGCYKNCKYMANTPRSFHTPFCSVDTLFKMGLHY